MHPRMSIIGYVCWLIASIHQSICPPVSENVWKHLIYNVDQVISCIGCHRFYNQIYYLFFISLQLCQIVSDVPVSVCLGYKFIRLLFCFSLSVCLLLPSGGDAHGLFVACLWLLTGDILLLFPSLTNSHLSFNHLLQELLQK